MQKFKIINAKIVNEGKIEKNEILIIGARIAVIGSNIKLKMTLRYMMLRVSRFSRNN